MPKDLHADIVTQIDAQSKRPCLLIEIELSSTLRYAANISDVVFPTAGNTYTAKAIRFDSVTQSLDGQVGTISLSLDNVSQDMAALVGQQDFINKPLIIKRIYLDSVSTADHYVEVFNGIIQKVGEISRYWVTFEATAGKPLNKNILKWAYYKKCQWKFGGDECNTDGNADLTVLTASGTADSGSTTTLVHSALTEADDYWNNGRITLTIGSNEYYRKVSDFDAASDTITFDIELPEAVTAATTYNVYKGCDQTWATCKAENTWGPSSDNYLNFGGFLHLGDPPETPPADSWQPPVYDDEPFLGHEQEEWLEYY